MTTLDPVGPDGASAMVDAVALGKEDREMGGRTTSAKTLWCEPGEGADLARTVGAEHLAYYDAIAPIVSAES